MNKIYFTLIFIFIFSTASQAALGEKKDIPNSKTTVIKNARAIQQNYRVIEKTVKATQVREYLLTDGTVFAVAWEGFNHPDLNTILGQYSDTYLQELQLNQGRDGKRHKTIKADDLVVEKWGHLRHLGGKAYLRSLLPAGVNLDEIK